MIRKAQIKFISIVMTILLVVFAVIFFTTYTMFINASNNHIEHTLNETKHSFLMDKDGIIHQNGLIVILSNDDTIQYKFYDEKIYNDDLISSIVNNVLSKPYTSGRYNDICYIVEQFNNDTFNGKMIVSFNATDIFYALRINILKSFLTLIIIYCLLFFIVWALSFKVFKPIKMAFFKQKQFISDASHELKTPLSIISANADVLRQEVNNQWLGNIKQQTERMDLLVADMLTLAKIDEGSLKLTKDEFNLSQIVIGCVLPFDAVAFEKGKTLDIDIDSDIIYNGDINSVKKIINILLDNAIKHSKKNGKILVTLKKESNKIVLSVYNTGSNIPDKQSNKIFERFYRGDNSRSRESGGSGLGLSIAKCLADTNKWKITANSQYHKSMKITVVM